MDCRNKRHNKKGPFQKGADARWISPEIFLFMKNKHSCFSRVNLRASTIFHFVCHRVCDDQRAVFSDIVHANFLARYVKLLKATPAVILICSDFSGIPTLAAWTSHFHYSLASSISSADEPRAKLSFDMYLYYSMPEIPFIQTKSQKIVSTLQNENIFGYEIHVKQEPCYHTTVPQATLQCRIWI